MPNEEVSVVLERFLTPGRLERLARIRRDYPLIWESIERQLIALARSGMRTRLTR